jgi:uncharacterized membrane protein
VSSTSEPAPRGKRAHAIDLLRLVASVQMIAGHTIGALLAPEHRVGTIFEGWTVARGLTAVAFLFASGAAFALVTRMDPSPDRTRRRVLRALALILLSYALHAPVAAVDGDPTAVAAAWRELFAVDVLACIGVTLLVLEGLARLPRFALSTAVLAAISFAASPLASTIDPEGPFVLFASYLTRRGDSLFPLLPYAGFALAGASIGSVAFQRPRSERALAVAAALVLGVGVLAWATTRPPTDAYYAWPALSLLRLGFVIASTAALSLATARVSRLPRIVTVLAGQSLFLYVSHLLVLYAGSFGLARAIGPTLSVHAALFAASLMVLASGAGALAFARSRFTRPR